jgi:large subunit ribosomal protein L4e
MFAPTKVWRRWHRRINLNQKRYAVCAALAASAVPSLVSARGHRIDRVPEIPLVVSKRSTDVLEKTKLAMKLLKKLAVHHDLMKVKRTKKIRPGKGKMRNRRYKKRKGVLVIYNRRSKLIRAMRNIPGVEFCSVTKLNLLQLAPGGHVGRFVLWVSDAFARLDSIFGTYQKLGKEKFGYRIPRPLLSLPDVGRLIHSEEIQSSLRPKKRALKYPRHKKNPLTNKAFMLKLNPYSIVTRRQGVLRSRRGHARNTGRHSRIKAFHRAARMAKRLGKWKELPKPTDFRLNFKKSRRKYPRADKFKKILLKP